MEKHKLKIRITVNDAVAMGPGKFELLQLIQHTGSITEAAKRMNMSYKRAWDLVKEMNRLFKEPLVATTAGGWRGGGSCVSAHGMMVIKCYLKLIQNVEHDDQFKKLKTLLH